MNLRLKPCPFCASRRVEVRYEEYHVECQDCGAQGPIAKTYSQAEELWNKRPSGKGDGKQH